MELFFQTKGRGWVYNVAAIDSDGSEGKHFIGGR